MQGTSQASTLYLRIPIWTNSEGATATINSQSLRLPAPGVKYNLDYLHLLIYRFLIFDIIHFISANRRVHLASSE